MPLPILVENELICPCGCGTVLQMFDDTQIIEQKAMPIFSTNMLLLGTAIQNNIKSSMRKSSQQFYEEQALRKLSDTAKEFGLPERFVIETFSKLKRNRRGFRSEIEPIKQLMRILSKDENYIHIKQLQKLKARYEKITNI